MSERPAVDAFHRLREKIAGDFMHSGRVSVYLRRHTGIIDRFVTALADSAGVPQSCAVAALGGYGRSEMFPFSDIDVLVLTPEGAGPDVLEPVGKFVTGLWDLGLTVGSSVRTRGEMLEAAANDITAATAFLEARLLKGDAALFEETYAEFAASLEPLAFFSRKMLEMRQRHQHYADTPYALEPNIKESPGGMRDLQVFLWCARVSGLGASWKEMAEKGVITDTEAYHLTACQHTLHDIRIRLHLMSRRHEDRIVFDLQTALAVSMGYRDTGSMLASEAMMKRYYINAKNVSQLTAIMLQALHGRISPEAAAGPAVPIDDAFSARGDVLDITGPDVFVRDPRAVLRTFYVFATRRDLKRMSTQLLRALWHSRYRINAAFRQDPENRAMFLRLLQLPYGPYHSLKNMNMWGILGRFIPPFSRIVGLMQHDLFHAYTVDQHTLKVVKYLRRFKHSEYAHEYPMCSQAANEIPGLWRVIVAGFFHDIGKGRGGDHSVIGAREARNFGESFGMESEDIDFVEFLVAEHITMSRVAQKEDISEPDVVRRFVETVRTRERLDALFILTVADIRATSPKVWNAWKQHLIEQLYTSSRRVLEGRGAEATRATVFAEHREEARKLTEALGVPARAMEDFWKDLDIVYFLRHTPENIAWHASELALSPEPAGAVVRCRDAVNGSGMEILVYVRDQKDLFARVVSCLGREGLSVLDARIHTTKAGWALDTFFVEDRRQRPDRAKFMGDFAARLARVIEARAPLPEPRPGKLSRRSRNFPTPPLVDIEHDEKQKSWVLQIVCTDRIGLLFAIAVVLARHGINLSTAKISTLDERAEDIFLINGPGLRDQARVVQLETELLAVIGSAA